MIRPSFAAACPVQGLAKGTSATSTANQDETHWQTAWEKEAPGDSSSSLPLTKEELGTHCKQHKHDTDQPLVHCSSCRRSTALRWSDWLVAGLDREDRMGCEPDWMALALAARLSLDGQRWVKVGWG